MDIRDQVRDRPYLTTGAIQFLEGFVVGKDVMEFGAGGTTYWLTPRVKSIVSIEQVPEWADAVRSKLNSAGIDSRVIVVGDPNFDLVEPFDDNSMDLVIVDAQNRVRCALDSRRLIRPGGVLMLDNSEREEYTELFEAFSDWELHQADQTEPDYLTGKMFPSWTTSWWIRPDKD